MLAEMVDDRYKVPNILYSHYADGDGGKGTADTPFGSVQVNLRGSGTVAMSAEVHHNGQHYSFEAQIPESDMVLSTDDFMLRYVLPPMGDIGFQIACPLATDTIQ